jgi:hypothetical protein
VGDGDREEGEHGSRDGAQDSPPPATDFPEPTAYAPRGWAPLVGDRVRLVTTGEIGTVLRLAPTEWGLLCDIELDPPPAPGRPARRTHAANELRPLNS